MSPEKTCERAASADDEVPLMLSLAEIASWHSGICTGVKPPIVASVPALQRGLVWRPQQIEMLWDSLLRGFPVGAFVVCRKIEAQDRGKVDGVSHHLLDGQQRGNAIALGFTDPFPSVSQDSRESAGKSILWLDLQPEGNANSTRDYWVRVTTLAHPWGYTQNDAVDKLPTHRIRAAVETIGLNPAAPDYKRPTPRQLWPSAAITPVPLAWLFLAPLDDPDAFWRYIAGRALNATCSLWTDAIRRLVKDGTSVHWTNKVRRFVEDSSANAIEQRASIYRAIIRAKRTKIIALTAPEELLEVSQQERVVAESQEPISNIEHLFQRLNQQGTRLDGEELAYSMVKAYWPELADPIDEIAHGRMPEARMVSLGVRAALAQGKTDRLPSPMTISALRAVAQGRDGRKEPIYQFIRTRLGGACAQVDRWLRYDKELNPSGLLPVHVTSIALGSPDVYLLLLCFAERLRETGASSEALVSWAKPLQGLATLLHWFAADKAAVANRIFERCQADLNLGNIRLALHDATEAETLLPVYSPKTIDEFVQISDTDLKDWNWWWPIRGDGDEQGIQMRRQQWYSFLNFRWNRELLLYAQRDFLASRFHDYDPARKDLWEAHNRPWDFDHILASYFFYNRKDRSSFRQVCGEWGYTIANLRAWPYEDNRSDQDDTAAEKLAEDAVRCEQSFLTPNQIQGYSGGDNVRRDEATARLFVESCRERLLRIYRNWYETLAIHELLWTEMTAGEMSLDSGEVERADLPLGVVPDEAHFNPTVTSNPVLAENETD